MEVEERKIKNEFKKQNSNSDLSGLKHDKKNLKERLNQVSYKILFNFILFFFFFFFLFFFFYFFFSFHFISFL